MLALHATWGLFLLAYMVNFYVFVYPLLSGGSSGSSSGISRGGIHQTDFAKHVAEQSVISASSPQLPPPPTTAYLLHVLNNRTQIEGTIFARLLRIHGKSDSDERGQYYDASTWKRTSCEGRTIEYLPGTCGWCPVGGENTSAAACISGGKFATHKFRDDHKGYSLETRGTLPLVQEFRPAWDKQQRMYGKAEMDTVYVTCSGLPRQVPFDVPGVLTVEHLPGVHLLVNARHSPPTTKRTSSTSSSSIVCTKAFYGDKLQTQTVLRFTQHYLEAWSVRQVFMYELGTTFGTTIGDVIRGNAKLRQYLAEGRILLVDLRPELQRLYGAWANSVVFFSSKNGQLMVAADCVNRAKQISAANNKQHNWVLHVDWDEILLANGVGAARSPSLPLLARRETDRLLKQTHRVSLLVMIFNRIRATERSICDDNCVTASTTRAQRWTYRRHHHPSSLAQPPLESEVKYAFVVSGDKYPKTWAYGVHVMSKCGYSLLNPYWKQLHQVNASEVYIRHYKCLNNPGCRDEDETSRPQANWALVNEW